RCGRDWRKGRGGAHPEIRAGGERAGSCRRSGEQAVSRGAAAATRASDDVEAAGQDFNRCADRVDARGAQDSTAESDGAGGAGSRARIYIAAERIGRGGARVPGDTGYEYACEQGLRGICDCGRISRMVEEIAREKAVVAVAASGRGGTRERWFWDEGER